MTKCLKLKKKTCVHLHWSIFCAARKCTVECILPNIWNPVCYSISLLISKVRSLGASSGICAATAVKFAKHEVKLAINGRNAENLEKTAKKCYEAGLKETEV